MGTITCSAVCLQSDSCRRLSRVLLPCIPHPSLGLDVALLRLVCGVASWRTTRVATPLSDSPAVVALTLPRTQRLDAMEMQWVLFLCSERWLARNESVPLVVRQARFVLARSTVGKLSASLLDYRLPRG